MNSEEKAQARAQLDDRAAKVPARISVSAADGDTGAPDTAIGRFTQMEALQALALSAAPPARQKTDCSR